MRNIFSGKRRSSGILFMNHAGKISMATRYTRRPPIISSCAYAAAHAICNLSSRMKFIRHELLCQPPEQAVVHDVGVGFQVETVLMLNGISAAMALSLASGNEVFNMRAIPLRRTVWSSKRKSTFMNSEWGWLVCAFFGCKVDPKTCVCLRCGRVRHLFGAEPKFMDTAYELCGQDKYGRMVYAKTSNKLYTCSRCGVREVQSASTYENH